MIGVRDRDLKGRLCILRQKGLLLQKALEMSKSNEVTKQQLKSLENEEKNSVEEIHEFKMKGRSRHKKPKKTFNQSTGNHTTRKRNQIRHQKEQMEKAKHHRKGSASIVAIRCTVKDKTVLGLARCVVSVIKAITSHQSAMPNGQIQ